jgi:hypothetical protein
VGVVRLGRGVRAVAAAACWTASVVVGLVSVAGFVGGTGCVQGGATTCAPPSAVLLVLGVIAAVALAAAGAFIHKPQAKRRKPRRPWQYLD